MTISLSKVQEKSAVVCQIKNTSEGQCGTGFLIGQNLIMTNCHVIPSSETQGTATFIINSEVIEVELDPASFFHCSKAPKAERPIKKVSKLDFTIVAIQPDERIAAVSHLAFSIVFNQLPGLFLGASMHIWHYPLQPNGISKQTRSEGHVTKIKQFHIFHTAKDTNKGSSGSPIMGNDGNLMAVHRGCFEEKSTLVCSSIPIATIWGSLNPSIQKDIEERYNATQDLSSYLKANYSKHLQFLSLLLTKHRFPIRDFFTQLSVVSQSSQEQKEKELRNLLEKRDPHRIEKDSLREIQARLYEASEAIEIKDFFKNGINRVLLIGRAGIGKSTLCQKVAYDWASDALFKQEFSVVYYLKLREFNIWITKNPLRDLQDVDEWLSFAISHFCYKGMHQAKVLEEMQKNPHKILIILDGWDEAQSAVTEAIERCLQIEIPLHYLVTSRPGVTHRIQPHFKLVVENMGFTTHEQIEMYAEKFFKQTHSSKLQDFLAVLHSNSHLMLLAHIPIQLQILCTLWKEGERDFPKTLTSLFAKITERLFHWEQSKNVKSVSEEHKALLRARVAASPDRREELLEALDRLFTGQRKKADWESDKLCQALGEVALEALDRKELIISQALVSAVSSNRKFGLNSKSISHRDLLSSGLVKPCGKDGEFYFVHLMYQEYCIARYISRLPDEYQERFIQTYRYKPQFHLVMPLLAGCLSKRYDESINWFFDWLGKGDVDLIGSYQRELVLACLNECDNADLEAKIWKDYRIAEFINKSLKHPCDLVLLNQTINSSLKAFKQVVNIFLEQVDKNQIIPFCCETIYYIRAEYLFNNLWDFMGKLLFHEDLSVCEAAFTALKELLKKSDNKSIDYIVPLMQMLLVDGVDYVRLLAHEVLGEVLKKADEKNAAKILIWLEKRLAANEYAVREDATKILRSIVKSIGKNSICKILNLLEGWIAHKDPFICEAAINALANIGLNAEKRSVPQILDWLERWLSDEDGSIRKKAILALVGIAKIVEKKDADQILFLLEERIIDKDPFVRETATKALGEIAKGVAEENLCRILDLLEKCFFDQSVLMHAAVSLALSNILKKMGEETNTQCLSWLKARLLSDRRFVSSDAHFALEDMRRDALSQVLSWLEAHQSTDTRVLYSVTHLVFESIRSNESKKNYKSLPNLSFIEQHLFDIQPTIQQKAAKSLVKFAKKLEKTDETPVLLLLERLLSSGDRVKRWVVLDTLKEIAKKARTDNIDHILSFLVKNFDTKDITMSSMVDSILWLIDEQLLMSILLSEAEASIFALVIRSYMRRSIALCLIPVKPEQYLIKLGGERYRDILISSKQKERVEEHIRNFTGF